MSFDQRIKNIHDAMEHFYCVDEMTLEKALEILRSIEDDLVLVWRERSIAEEDYRLGNDTYGYDGNDEGFLGHLCYISDRWGCAYRIAWVLGLIDPEYREGIL